MKDFTENNMAPTTSQNPDMDTKPILEDAKKICEAYKSLAEDSKKALISDALREPFAAYWGNLDNCHKKTTKSFAQYEQAKKSRDNAKQALEEAQKKLEDAEKKVTDAKNAKDNSLQELYKQNTPSRDFLDVFNVACAVELCEFSGSFNLAPLAIDPKLPGRIEQLHGNVMGFALLSDSNLKKAKITLEADIVTFFDHQCLNRETVKVEDTSPKWMVTVNSKPYIHISLSDDKIEAAWDVNLTTEDINTANSLLFSVLVFTLKGSIGSLLPNSIKKQCCQFLKPSQIAVESTFVGAIPEKKKRQPRHDIARIKLVPPEFMKNEIFETKWLADKLLNEGEFEMAGFDGEANFVQPPSQNETGSSKGFPEIILSAHCKNTIPDTLSQAHCRVSLIKDEVELILFGEIMKECESQRRGGRREGEEMELGFRD